MSFQFWSPHLVFRSIYVLLSAFRFLRAREQLDQVLLGYNKLSKITIFSKPPSPPSPFLPRGRNNSRQKVKQCFLLVLRVTLPEMKVHFRCVTVEACSKDTRLLEQRLQAPSEFYSLEGNFLTEVLFERTFFKITICFLQTLKFSV